MSAALEPSDISLSDKWLYLTANPRTLPQRATRCVTQCNRFGNGLTLSITSSAGTGKSASLAAVSRVSALMVAKVRPRAAGAALEGNPSEDVDPPLLNRTSGRPNAPLQCRGRRNFSQSRQAPW